LPDYYFFYAMSLNFTHAPGNTRCIFLSNWIWLFFALSSCGEQDEYVINVDLKSNQFLEGKKVYLGEQATKIFLDSAIVKNGKFQFRVNTDQNFTPFEASMLYATGDKNYPFWLLGYKNPYKEKTYMSQFYVDKGTMNFVIDTSSKFEKKEIIDFIFLNINKQTEATYKHWAFNPAISPVEKSKDVRTLIINQFPTSQHLLRQIDLNKSKMKDTEVKGLLLLFDESVHSTPIYKRLAQYLHYHYNNGNEIPHDITVFDSTFLPAKLKVDSTKYNLIVFWASWCGPCRREIPQLTNLYNTHRNILNIQSISIDQNEKAWKGALKHERMQWPQMLLERDSSFTKFDKKYNLDAIPLSLLFDSQGKLVSRQLGIEIR
jgi:thiol-disulfide isomerase/thioredoxin